MGGNYLSLKEEGSWSRAQAAGQVSERETADNDDDLLLQQKKATHYFVDHICKFLEVLDSWDVEMPISICSAVYHIFCTHKLATEYPI